MQLRRAGYLARDVEVELFEPGQAAGGMARDAPARASCDRRRLDGGGRSAVCAELARAEPVGKPHPDDPAATTWRIRGPGGHVRHYVARRSIEEHLQGRNRPFDGDPADLKIPWAYGFFVRACEEVLPQDMRSLLGAARLTRQCDEHDMQRSKLRTVRSRSMWRSWPCELSDGVAMTACSSGLGAPPPSRAATNVVGATIW